MIDLFGQTVTAPVTSKPSAILNLSHGFAEFWAAYPPGSRKVGKQQCLNKWAKLECAENAAHILAHVEWLKTTDQWLRGIIPLTTTYINQTRWLDWTPEPARAKKLDVLAEIKAHQGSKPSAEVLAAIKRIKQGVTA